MPDPEALLCAILRDEHPAWPADADAVFANALIERGGFHGVLPLIHGKIVAGKRTDWPASMIEQCRQQAISHAMWELRHRTLLDEVFARLADVDIVPVVFKGTALAYTLYPQAALRTRGDTDLIIPEQAKAALAESLAGLGFEREHGVSGESISYEASFTHSEPGSGTHTLDVHWRINNSELLSKLFTHAELLATAQGLPGLGEHARGASPVFALLIACMHRATHKHNPYYVNGVAYYSGDRLIWLYDIHLLAGMFSGEQWTEFVRLAEKKGLCAVCLEGLERTAAAFHTDYPKTVRTLLSRPGNSERVARYFAGGVLRQQWMNFCAIPGISRKLRFISQTLFPPADYMRVKYPEGGWLPVLYLRRAVGGLAKRILNPGRAS